jgi:hypothetical protein
MTDSPDLEEFARQIDGLRTHPDIGPLLESGVVRLGELTREQIAGLARPNTASYYFLIAAAGLNRTTLQKAVDSQEARIVAPPLRRAFAIQRALPKQRPFDDIARVAVALRKPDLGRRQRGEIEQLFRERLQYEGIPILMSPPVRQVPGLLIRKRKPDGVYPDPATGAAPKLYLEIKNIRRVADDIQKRLYEVAEASLEMKFLYGDLRLQGLDLRSTRDVVEQTDELRARLRAQIVAAAPAVVVLMLCSRVEAEKYRDAARAFVDEVFFEEEIEECLAYLKKLAL